jgi:predicted nuclease of restriction endonuclease-like (RecB) superfamily
MSAKTQNISQYGNLVSEIGKLLSEAKKHIANTVNTTMVMTNWHIGKYIVEYEQGGKVRAGYGKQLLKRLSEDLIKTYGRGYSYRNLQLCKKFYTTFPIVQTVIAQLENSEKSEYPDKEKVQTNSAQFSEKLLASLPKLSWSHFVRLLSLKNEDERNFYIIETAENHWTERELDRQINSALFERLVLSKDKKAVKELSTKGQQIQTETDVLKDPLVLEFLNLRQEEKYSESELESAIIQHLESFLLELGKGFTFVARQQRISSGTEHFYIDLVFYNRLLKAFVLFDLKIGKLKHQDIGQMQMYVNYYDREIKTENENPTIGIILCKENDDFVIEYTLPENNKQIFANEYKLYLPDKKELKKLLYKYI